MDSYEYQLTIKSANQKVDDYVTKCCSSWNVKRLKQHISETHTNKPSIEDQRLIYAGNLLKDHQILKQIFFRDSLCTELTNSSKTDFTIHLVCSQQKIVNNNANRATNTNTSSLTNNNNINNNGGSNNNNRASSSTTAASLAPNNQATTAPSPINRPTTSINLQIPIGAQDRLTFGTTTTPPGTSSNITTTTTTTIRLNNQNQTTSITRSTPITLINNQLTTTISNGQSAQQTEMIQNLMQSDHMRQQLAVFQHLACMVASQLAQNINRIPQTNTPAPQIVEQQAPIAARAGAGPAPAEQDAPVVQHDVIDWVYYSIRAFVLMAALYIHASMFRLFFIVGILATAYFFHRGSFRRRARQQQQQNQQQPLAQQAQEAVQQQNGELGNNQQENGELRRRNQNVGEQPFNGGGGEGEINNGVEQRETPQQEDRVAPGRLPILKLCYLVLTDFLASLVPE